MTRRSIIQPIIMSGGAGTRLWPMSRAARPKQFLPLLSDRSLFQETVARYSGSASVAFADPVIIAGAGHADIIRAQLDAIGVRAADIIIEPVARNTAAVAAVAAAWTAANNPEALVLLAPADHHIADPGAFRDAVASGAAAAEKGAIVTFGIQPTEAHTGFGYIEAGAPIAPGVAEVAAFREKPNRETAEHYFASGRHFWNAGVFLYSPDAMSNELAALAPAIRLEAVAAYERAARDGPLLTLDSDRFAACPENSIDYAVMEKTRRGAVVGPIGAGWSDIGSWTAIPDGKDAERVAAIDCESVLIRTDGPFIGAIGVSDLIIVATGDAVLVAPKSRAQDVKKIIDELKARGLKDLL